MAWVTGFAVTVPRINRKSTQDINRSKTNSRKIIALLEFSLNDTGVSGN
jgi:hypothetical protein